MQSVIFLIAPADNLIVSTDSLIVPADSLIVFRTGRMSRTSPRKIWLVRSVGPVRPVWKKS